MAEIKPINHKCEKMGKDLEYVRINKDSKFVGYFFHNKSTNKTGEVMDYCMFCGEYF